MKIKMKKEGLVRGNGRCLLIAQSFGRSDYWEYEMFAYYMIF